jgi:hypothetical protein
VSVRAADGGGVSYRAVTEVMRSIDLQEALLAQAERELIAFERRYSELLDICQLLAMAREAIQRRRAATKVEVLAPT